MKPIVSTLAAACLIAAASANAQSGAELLKSKGCDFCHAQDARKVGPAFSEVAAKHKGDADALNRLMAKLKEGQRHPKVGASDAEIRAMLTHVLSGR